MMPSLVFALLAAMIPAAITVFLIWWFDQYEREPVKLIAATALWGALPAVIISLVLERSLGLASQAQGPGQLNQLTRAWLVSPVVEEVAKGLALVGLYLFFKLELDDLVDGIVYGVVVGAGFAMTENFLYFLGAALRGDIAHLLVVGLVRGVLFGLNHSFYAAITGVGIALAASARVRPGWLAVGLGLIGAISVHMLHNLTTILAGVHPAFLIVSALLNWGGVLVFVFIIATELQKEHAWIQLYLADEVPLVISSSHYALVQDRSTRTARWSALLAGKSLSRARLEAEMQQTASELALYKHRLAASGKGSDPADSRALEDYRRRLVSLDRALAQQG